MKKAVIIGGKLQGVEALYLAKKAGIETTLVDKNPYPIGQNFCNRFICQDVIQYSKALLAIFCEADFVLPAMENKEALKVLKELEREHGFHLIFDPHAYGISSSKLLSDEAMAKANLPVPLYYPKGIFPYIAKPSSMSGSEGVAKIGNQEEMDVFLKIHGIDEDLVIQEFLEGPSYSIEIIGTPGNYKVYHVTELYMDKEYDCKRVMFSPDFPKNLETQFREIAFSLGDMVQLHGIMDVEVIDCNGILKILEIDARIPSQTPATIYHGTGINFMEELYQSFAKEPEPPTNAPYEKTKFVSYEQLLVKDGCIEILGEHVLAKAKNLQHKYNFCGADEAITNYEDGKKEWVATMICVAETKEVLAEKRNHMFQKIGQLQGRTLQVLDLEPIL